MFCLKLRRQVLSRRGQCVKKAVFDKIKHATLSCMQKVNFSPEYYAITSCASFITYIILVAIHLFLLQLLRSLKYVCIQIMFTHTSHYV